MWHLKKIMDLCPKDSRNEQHSQKASPIHVMSCNSSSSPVAVAIFSSWVSTTPQRGPQRHPAHQPARAHRYSKKGQETMGRIAKRQQTRTYCRPRPRGQLSMQHQRLAACRPPGATRAAGPPWASNPQIRNASAGDSEHCSSQPRAPLSTHAPRTTRHCCQNDRLCRPCRPP